MGRMFSRYFTDAFSASEHRVTDMVGCSLFNSSFLFRVKLHIRLAASLRVHWWVTAVHNNVFPLTRRLHSLSTKDDVEPLELCALGWESVG